MLYMAYPCQTAQSGPIPLPMRPATAARRVTGHAKESRGGGRMRSLVCTPVSQFSDVRLAL
jgi:hypothetical protein